MKKSTLLAPAIFLTILISSCQKDNNAATPAAGVAKSNDIDFTSDALHHPYNPVSNGLIAYFPFCGNANDATRYANNGTLNDFDSQNISYGLPTLTADKYGHPNSAFHFNGLSDFIDLNNGDPLAYGGSNVSEFSIYLRFKTDTAGTLLYAGGRFFNYAELIVNQDRSVAFNWNIFNPPSNTTASVSGGPVTYNPNKWVDVVLNFKSSCLILYLNGTLVGFNHINYSTGPVYNGFRIGASFGTFPFNYFKGTIDEVRLYNKALTKPEIDYLLAH